MKKAVLALAAFMLVTPALAGITVDCTIDGNEVTVTYAMDGGDPNLPRAFGLDIAADANISMDTSLPSSDINDSDFYIYPGTIDVNDDTGDVDNYGTPVASLEGPNMTIEMGSLWADNDPDHNTPPPSSGWLIKFRVNKASDIYVDITENFLRSGVVMQDTEADFPGGYVTCGDCCSVPEGPYTISGTVTYMGSGLSGVTMNGLPGAPVTDGNGDYSDTVPSGWDGTVTPTKDPNYAFDPPSRVYVDVASDQLNEDYCAYPGCWDCLTQCHGDVDCSGKVDTSDWPGFADSWYKSYPNAAYNPCADNNRDGVVNTSDWPEFADHWYKFPTADCAIGDPCGIYCP
jgi:hypothetical protein